MTNEILQQILDFITKNAELLASAAFRLALRQIYFYAYADLIGGTLGLILGIAVAVFGIKWSGDEEKMEDGPGWVITVGLIVIIVSIITIFMSARYFFNPNWYAVHLLIEQVR